VGNFAEGNGDGETFEKGAKRVGNLSRACDIRSFTRCISFQFVSA